MLYVWVQKRPLAFRQVSLSCTSYHFLFNISSPICLLKITTSNSFLLLSTLFPSAANQLPIQQHSFVSLWFLYHKSLFSCPSSNQKLYLLSLLFHLLTWLHCNWLYWVEILSCSTFNDPCVMEFLLLASTSTLEKPEICFWMILSTSITHFSSCWQFQR